MIAPRRPLGFWWRLRAQRLRLERAIARRRGGRAPKPEIPGKSGRPPSGDGR